MENRFFKFKKLLLLLVLCFSHPFQMSAEEETPETPYLQLEIISYEDFNQSSPETIERLVQALYTKGIVGIKGIPGYQEKVFQFISVAKEFSALPEEIKELCAPNFELGDTFLGYEKGKEKFQRPDGTWVIDDLKTSYYADIPDVKENKWPKQIDLKTPYQELGLLMTAMGQAVMEKAGLTGPKTGLEVNGLPSLGRMLYYKKSTDSDNDNPLWCGAHFDLGVFTAILPAFYYVNGEQVPEPAEAGLFIRTQADQPYQKVAALDSDVLMFQVGEFGQLATDDGIRATEHMVRKAKGIVERYTMAVFFHAPFKTPIYSHSVLTADSRYGGNAGDPCTYEHWRTESFKRYVVREEKQ